MPAWYYTNKTKPKLTPTANLDDAPLIFLDYNEKRQPGKPVHHTPITQFLLDDMQTRSMLPTEQKNAHLTELAVRCLFSALKEDSARPEAIPGAIMATLDAADYFANNRYESSSLAAHRLAIICSCRKIPTVNQLVRHCADLVQFKQYLEQPAKEGEEEYVNAPAAPESAVGAESVD